MRPEGDGSAATSGAAGAARPSSAKAAHSSSTGSLAAGSTVAGRGRVVGLRRWPPGGRVPAAVPRVLGSSAKPSAQDSSSSAGSAR